MGIHSRVAKRIVNSYNIWLSKMGLRRAIDMHSLRLIAPIHSMKLWL